VASSAAHAAFSGVKAKRIHRLTDGAAVVPEAAPGRQPSRWRQDVWCHMRRYFLLKFVGISSVTWFFFIGYFYLLRYPAYAVTVMPLTVLDDWIAFQPSTLVAYFSLWVYVGFAPGLLWGFRELLVYGLWAVGLCLAGLTFFYFWPTEVPAMMQPPSDFPGFSLLQGVDAAGNACPSMHVAMAIFSAICLHDVLRRLCVPRGWQLFNGAWFLAIAYSTLALKQHVVIDVVLGMLLGLIFALAALRWRSRSHPDGRYSEVIIPTATPRFQRRPSAG
jgi:membrane-associated phospholipid phosphatase